MSKFRYSSSFLISSSIYTLLLFLYIDFLNTPKPVEKKKEHIVKIAVITPPAPPKVEPKPVVVPPKPIVTPPKPKKKKIIKKPKPKPKPKKKIVKKPKPKPKPKKKIVKKSKPTPPPIIEEVYEEEVYEVYQEPIREIEPNSVVVRETPPPTPKVDLSAHKQRFKDRVRASIIANKKYPRTAKRRRIQGTVHVVFDIGVDGLATNIRTSGASNILQKATKRSIKKSFPITIPDILIDEFPMRNVSINIDFILE